MEKYSYFHKTLQKRGGQEIIKYWEVMSMEIPSSSATVEEDKIFLMFLSSVSKDPELNSEVCT